tara:strand:+ start:218 stop:895 length:678 start_codon:yes stop_codon:yes gene_type:complete
MNKFIKICKCYNIKIFTIFTAGVPYFDAINNDIWQNIKENIIKLINQGEIKYFINFIHYDPQRIKQNMDFNEQNIKAEIPIEEISKLIKNKSNNEGYLIFDMCDFYEEKIDFESVIDYVIHPEYVGDTIPYALATEGILFKVNQDSTIITLGTHIHNLKIPEFPIESSLKKNPLDYKYFIDNFLTDVVVKNQQRMFIKIMNALWDLSEIDTMDKFKEFIKRNIKN